MYTVKPNLTTPASNASYRAVKTAPGVSGSGSHNAEAPSRLAQQIVGRRLELSSPSLTPVKCAKPVVLTIADQLFTTPTRGQKRARADDAPDAPSFELDIDEHNEASTPVKKDGKATLISPTSATKTHSDHLVGQLMMLNNEIGDTEGHIVFGQVNITAVTKIKATHTGFTKDPWSSNWLVRTRAVRSKSHQRMDAIKNTL